MAWISLILAGVCEMIGVAMMNKWNNDGKWTSILLLTLGFGASFLFLSLAMETLPMGTAYFICAGIGGSGGVIVVVLFYGELWGWRWVLFIFMILGSAVGLKLVS